MLRALTLVAAALLAGCIVPTGNVPSEGFVPPERIAQLQGRTRADVLVQLGPPELRRPGDRIFGYAWNEMIAAFIFAGGYSAGGFPIDRKKMLLLEFDDAGIVRRAGVVDAMTKAGLETAIEEWSRK